MGSFLVIPKIPRIKPKTQMNYIVWNWIRLSCNPDTMRSFPFEIIELIVDAFLYQTVFDKSHQTKINNPIRYEKMYKKCLQDDIQDSQTQHHSRGYYLFKILIVGDNCVGKTSLVKTYVKDEFRASYNLGMGVRYVFNTMNIDDKVVELQIGDPFARPCISYYRRVQLVIMVYDITDHKSFENIKKWNKSIEGAARDFVIKVLFANKIDLISDNQCVDDKEAKKLVKELEIEQFSKVSAETAQNVDEAFDSCFKYMFNFFSNQPLRAMRPFYG